MNVEDFREYCLSLGEVEEELLKELVAGSFEIVKGKYEKKKKSSQNWEDIEIYCSFAAAMFVTFEKEYLYDTYSWS